MKLRHALLVFLFACASLASPHAYCATPAVSGGGNHGMALSVDGSVRSWGDDSAGELGIGRSLGSANPVSVNGLSGVVALAAGDSHVLALKMDGTVWAWGNNSTGQLGDGSTISRSTPVQVQGLAGVTAISAGSSHSAALTADGSVWTWGANYRGQLGVDADNSALPVRVTTLTGVIAISASSSQTFALRNDGTVWGWGANDSGQLGNGTVSAPYTGISAPAQVTGLTNVIGISAGGLHTLARKSDSSVWAWGDNSAGQLGNGTTTASAVPLRIAALDNANVAAISAGYDHSMALLRDGSVLAWGGNGYGNLGDGTYIDRPLPVPLPQLTGIIALSTGFLQSAAVRFDGTVFTWGYDDSGQLGDGTYNQESTPILSNASGVTLIAVGDSFMTALRTDGSVLTWGDDSQGQLGVGTRIFSATPQVVIALGPATAIAAGGIHSVALTADGNVWAWGNNSEGQLGNTAVSSSSTPVQVPGLSAITAIAAGYYHSLALASGGAVFAWGYNYTGELGTATTSTTSTVVQVSGLGTATAVAAGGGHSLALMSDGSVWAWGANDSGQLGTGAGTLTAQGTGNPTPAAAIGLSNVIAIVAGDSHSVALKSDGTVWTWGNNYGGQLGNNSTTNSPIPVQVANLSNVIAIAAGSSHTVAVRSDGSVWAWGTNYDGRLGDGTTDDQLQPVPVSGLGGVARVAAGGSNTIALKQDNSVWAWGANDVGQLGDGTQAFRLTPVVVLRENANGSIRTADWFLDLNPASLAVIPPQNIPPFLVLTTSQGGATNTTVNADIKFDTSVQGTPGAIFITAKVPAGTLLLGRGAMVKNASARSDASANPQYVQVQLTPAGWQPVVNGQLVPYVTGVLGSALASQTILNNTDTTQISGADFCLGYGADANAMLASGTIRSVATVAGAPPGTVVTCIPASSFVPQSGYWWNPAEGGRGFTIEQNGTSGNVFFATYLYDASGRPTWYAAGPAPMTGQTFSAPLEAFSGGQTLTGSYQTPTQGASPGNVSITFSDADDATLTWPEGTIQITRYAIVPGGLTATPPATQPQAGYWWNPAEGGRGYTIEVQNNSAFIAAYMYDTSGNPVWYAAGPAALTGNNAYVGNWTTYTGGQTLTGSYHAPTGTANAGSLTVQFISPTSATLTLPDGRQIPIQRYAF
jgi:alpha-tubulin suppressor-like RCC1 family protein